jgi:hypothetical protein
LASAVQQSDEKELTMKRVLSTFVLVLFMLGTALAANVFKFTFPGISYPDGRVGTIQASVKTTKRGSVTVCGYFSDPNDQYLGQFQGDDNTSTDAVVVRDYCLGHYGDRTP